MSNLAEKAKKLRLDIIELSHKSKTAHIGSCLSCVDILVAALNGGLNLSPQLVSDPARDRLVFSKGHCAAALFCAISQAGFFPKEKLFAEFNSNGGVQEHPNLNAYPGVEVAAGSLGHGLPLGLGMALAARITGLAYRICVIMGDGECNEGSVWEAAMLAAAQKTGNLIAVVDANRWQATGRSNEIMALEPLADKWRAFGWNVIETDGNNPEALLEIMRNAGYGDKPLAIVARTIKGKGVSFMEDDNNWHYRMPSDAEMEQIRRELA